MKVLWNFAISTVATAVALWVVTLFVPGIRVDQSASAAFYDGPYTFYVAFLVAAAVIVGVNLVVGPVVRTIGLPLNIVTIGLFSVAINAFLLVVAGLLSDQMNLGLQVDDFMSAVWGSLIISIVTSALSPFTRLLRGFAR